MVVIAVLVALSIGAIALLTFADLAGGSVWPFAGASAPTIDSSKWYDVTRSAIGIVGLAGLGGGAIIAYRRQQTAERRQAVEEARQKTEEARQRTEEARSSLERDRHNFEVEKRRDGDLADLRARYAKAAEQLGHAKAAVRLAGVYAMVALADDWFVSGNQLQQRVCVDVLCAYLRMPYEPGRADIGEKEVRLTIFSVIREKLQDSNSDLSWCAFSLDFTGAVIDGGNLSGAIIRGQMIFDQARIIGDFDFQRASLVSGQVSFQRAEFITGTVSFRGSSIKGGGVCLDFARFSGGDLSFSRTSISGGMVSLRHAELNAGRIDFNNMVMAAGEIDVFWPKFNGGLMTFTNAELAGGKCRVMGWNFRGGAIRFSQSKFSGADVNLMNIGVHEESSFVLDFSSPEVWSVPPKVPGRNAASNPWSITSADTDGPAEFVLPREWPPSEEKLPF